MSPIWSSLQEAAPFDRLVRLAVRLTDAPMAMVSLERDGEFRALSWTGIPEPWASTGEMPQPYSFCDHVMRSGAADFISDTGGHPRLVKGSAGDIFNVAAYLGLPLRDADDRVVGVFAVMDTRPREWTPQQIESLQDLALSAVTEVELRARTRALERAQAEQREGELRFRQLAENIRAAFWIFDPEFTRTLYVSPAYEEIWGESREGLLHDSRYCVKQTLPEDRARLAEAMSRMAREQQTVQFRIRHPSGEVRWLEARGFPVRNERDEVYRIAGLTEDVTDRKQAEEALRESEQRFRLMVENVHDYAIILLDAQGRIIQWNPGAERMKGYREEEILGRHMSVFYSEEDRARGKPRQILEIALREGHYEDEGWRVGRDGTRFWASVVITALRDERGGTLGFAMITRDLTERHTREEQLRRQGEMVQLLQHVAVAANEAATIQEALQDTLEHVCAQAGFAVGHAYMRATDGSGELISTGLWHLEDRVRFEAFRQETESRRVPRGVGLPGRVFESGEIEWMLDVTSDDRFARAAAARQADLRAAISFPVLIGDAVAAVLEFFSSQEIALDPLFLQTMANVGTQLGRVFERKQAEEAVLRAKEEAERANRAKSEFLSRMSHELRTPLNAILGFGQLLESDVQKEDDRESVEQILRAGRHLLDLVDEVLDLARIEAERITLSLEPVSVPELTEEAFALLRSLAAQKDVQLHLAAPTCSHHVRADQQRLKQVLLNLLSNAIKYNRRGGSVTVRCEESSAGTLRVEVEDTGTGVSPDTLSRMFTPFDRLGAEQLGIEGIGLGLALTKGLVEAMGGRIGVRSEVGEGSTFWVELPLADPSEDGEEPEAADGAPFQEGASQAAEARTILYIEDNLSNLRLVERILARRPRVALHPAMQGRMGLDLARQLRPDLILLDAHLPDIGGEEVLGQLRQEPELRDVPVVMISADATPRQIERFRGAGAQDYLTKPIDVRLFLAVVDEWLGVGSVGGD